MTPQGGPDVVRVHGVDPGDGVQDTAIGGVFFKESWSTFYPTWPSRRGKFVHRPGRGRA